MQTPFIIHRRVRFGDCDPGGVIYTPRLSYFVIEAVLDFLSERLGGPAERRILEMGILPPARALSIEFLAPLAWDDTIATHVAVTELRTSAIAYSIVGFGPSGTKVFTSEFTQVCVSAEARRPVYIPAQLRAALPEAAGV